MKQMCIILSALLVLTMFAACQLTSPSVTEEPSQTAAPETEATQEPTLPSETTSPSEPEQTIPPETTEPLPTETEVTLPANYIGTLYTREQLEAMPGDRIGYGPGLTSSGKRAPYAVSDQQTYGKYGTNFIAPDNGCIYLTFDCGYEYFAKDENGNSYPVTGRILDVLKAKNVKAVFFITLHYAKSNPALVQRMLDEGHTVGNHTTTHPDMSQISIDQMVYEIMTLHDYMLEHFGYKMTLFRPPTGAFSIRSLAVTQSLGYKTVHWSFAYADWDPDNQPTIDAALDRIQTSAHSGAIYLLHAESVTNATVLGDVIDYFRVQNYDLQMFQ